MGVCLVAELSLATCIHTTLHMSDDDDDDGKENHLPVSVLFYILGGGR